MSHERLAAAILALAVVATGLGVVYAEHQSRKLFVQLQGLQAAQDRMNEEWGRLQLEQSTWATHGRIERIARQELKMHIPQADEIVFVDP